MASLYPGGPYSKSVVCYLVRPCSLHQPELPPIGSWLLYCGKRIGLGSGSPYDVPIPRMPLPNVSFRSRHVVGCPQLRLSVWITSHLAFSRTRLFAHHFDDMRHWCQSSSYLGRTQYLKGFLIDVV